LSFFHDPISSASSMIPLLQLLASQFISCVPFSTASFASEIKLQWGFLEAWGMNSLICFCTVRVYFLLQFCSPTAYTQNWQYVPGLAKKHNPSLWLQKTFRHTDRFRKGNNSLMLFLVIFQETCGILLGTILWDHE
jgi:hypothetical protein